VAICPRHASSTVLHVRHTSRPFDARLVFHLVLSRLSCFCLPMSTVCNDQIYLFGGEYQSEALNDLYLFDPGSFLCFVLLRHCEGESRI